MLDANGESFKDITCHNKYIFTKSEISKLNIKNYPSYRTIYNSVLNIGQWLNSSSKDGTKYHA
jgi:hypothetical protein